MLKVENINQSFVHLQVLKDISFTVNDDEIVAIIGPSGCGKSTLLNIISGLQKPEDGTVHNSSDKIAFMFQDDRLLPWLSVYDNIKVVNDNHNNEVISKLIEDVGLSGFENYKPEQISGGMKKRCGIARAFYYDSKLLLMDEAFQGLDYCLRQEMIKMLMRVWNNNKQSVLFITHEIDEALTVASRIVVLSDRPATIIKEYVLPPYENRMSEEEILNKIRNEIISLITK
jgi:NitT/TauT family transport system ATP-binding protein